MDAESQSAQAHSASRSSNFDSKLDHSILDHDPSQPVQELCQKIHSHELLEKIGQGGMAWVFRARARDTGQIVALKALPLLAYCATTRQRFVREISILRSLSHPAMIRLFDYGQATGLLYYTMDFFEQGDLRSWIKKHGPLTEQQAARWLLQPLQGLHFLHLLSSRKIIHRDLKPSNLFLKAPGELVIGDFGLAMRDQDRTMTATRSRLGTPHYMSPEQVLGRAHFVDARTDVYAMGAVLSTLVTGRKPFSLPPSAQKSQRDSLERLLNRVLHTELALPDTLSPAMRSIIRRATAKQVRNRTANARELHDQLAAFLKGQNPQPKKPPRDRLWTRLRGIFRKPESKRPWREQLAERKQLQPTLQRAQRLLERGCAQQALNVLEVAESDFADFQCLKAQVLRALQARDRDSIKLELAELEALDKALKDNPQSWLAHCLKGDLHSRKQRHQLALPCYQQALSILPHAQLHERLRDCYTSLGQAAQAKDHHDWLERVRAYESQRSQPSALKSPEIGLDNSLFEGAPRPTDLRQLGPYKILEKLGEGGMGEIYKAEDSEQKHQLTLKVLHPLSSATSRAQFRQEYEWLRRLRSCPHVVRVDDFGELHGRAYYAMETIAGSSLMSQILCRQTPQEPTQAFVDLALKLAEALARLHQQGAIHGDLKPHNILYDAVQQRYRFIDPLCPPEPTETGHSPQGAQLGSPCYMSPERLTDNEFSLASDIYSLGAIFYELLSQRPPVRANPLAETPPKIHSIRPETPKNISEIIHRCLDKDPKKRPAIDELIVLLKTVTLDEDSQGSSKGSVWSRVRNIWRPREVKEAHDAGPEMMWQRAENYWALARHEQQAQRFDKAKEANRWALEACPNHFGALLLQAQLYAEQGQPVKAWEWLNEHHQRLPQTPVLKLLSAACAFLKEPIGSTADFVVALNDARTVTQRDYLGARLGLGWTGERADIELPQAIHDYCTGIAPLRPESALMPLVKLAPDRLLLFGVVLELASRNAQAELDFDLFELLPLTDRAYAEQALHRKAQICERFLQQKTLTVTEESLRAEYYREAFQFLKKMQHRNVTNLAYQSLLSVQDGLRQSAKETLRASTLGVRLQALSWFYYNDPELNQRALELIHDEPSEWAFEGLALCLKRALEADSQDTKRWPHDWPSMLVRGLSQLPPLPETQEQWLRSLLERCHEPAAWRARIERGYELSQDDAATLMTLASNATDQRDRHSEFLEVLARLQSEDSLAFLKEQLELAESEGDEEGVRSVLGALGIHHSDGARGLLLGRLGAEDSDLHFNDEIIASLLKHDHHDVLVCLARSPATQATRSLFTPRWAPTRSDGLRALFNDRTQSQEVRYRALRAMCLQPLQDSYHELVAALDEPETEDLASAALGFLKPPEPDTRLALRLLSSNYATPGFYQRWLTEVPIQALTRAIKRDLASSSLWDRTVALLFCAEQLPQEPLAQLKSNLRALTHFDDDLQIQMRALKAYARTQDSSALVTLHALYFENLSRSDMAKTSADFQRTTVRTVVVQSLKHFPDEDLSCAVLNRAIATDQDRVVKDAAIDTLIHWDSLKAIGMVVQSFFWIEAGSETTAKIFEHLAGSRHLNQKIFEAIRNLHPDTVHRKLWHDCLLVCASRLGSPRQLQKVLNKFPHFVSENSYPLFLEHRLAWQVRQCLKDKQLEKARRLLACLKILAPERAQEFDDQDSPGPADTGPADMGPATDESQGSAPQQPATPPTATVAVLETAEQIVEEPELCVAVAPVATIEEAETVEGVEPERPKAEAPRRSLDELLEQRLEQLKAEAGELGTKEEAEGPEEGGLLLE